MRNKIASARRSIRIAAIFSALVFLILALTMIITVTVTMFLYRRDILRLQRLEVTIPVYAGISVIVGTIMSRFAGKRPIGRIIEINEATKEVARGNFDVVVDEDIQATELREMAHSFNIMTRELAAKKLLHTDFIENVSHEFRTPLSAIEGYAILLRRKSVSDEMRVEYAKKILNNTQRLTALTGNILLLSRLEPGELILEKKPFSLDEQLREIILMLESEWTAKDLELDIELESITYSGSRELLYHVWHNLLTNAVKFSNKGGKIIIRLSSFPDSIHFTITDEGIGMSKATLERVFEKFYQGDTSRSTYGSGLGLSLAKRVVEVHSGTISAASHEGRGATFLVTLPISEKD